MKNLVLIFVTISGFVFAQQQNPPIKKQHPVSSIQRATQIIQQKVQQIFKYDSVPDDPFHTRVYTLPNGLKVYLSPYHVTPRIFTMIAVKAGSKYDPHNATGLAHYLEHMLFKGTDKFGTKDYSKEKPLLDKIEELFEIYRQTTDSTKRKKIYHQIDSISLIASKYAIANEYDKMLASIGARSTNAFTTNDETVYINDIPSNQIDNWLAIEAERFRNPVFRLFHTELEAVYEEKNRSLDNDEWQMYEAFYKNIFPDHPYGTQTTIGTVEHLKNPSLKEIKKYYDTYYVPNNMAIIMCGDFNPDTVIKKIWIHFGNMQSKAVPPLKFKSPNLTQRVQTTVYGPKSEMLLMGWKTDGAASKDALYISIISNLLYNGKSGLIDNNLINKQKLLSASIVSEALKDYSYIAIYAEPKEKQSLEEVEKLLLEQIHLLQQGEFDNQLLKDILTNKKLELQQKLENNFARAFTLFSAFTKDVPLHQIVNEINELKKITKQDIIHFSQQYFKDDNYAVVYKKTGENKNIKVTKPAITPVELDRKNTSEFVKQITENQPKPIQPKFIDFKKDIQIYPVSISNAQNTRTLELLYNKNTENELFELTYYYSLDPNKIKEYSIVFKYLNKFPATETMSTEELQKKLYQLGCDISFYASQIEGTAYITISGLSENMQQAINIAESILNQTKIDNSTFAEFINDFIKQREDEKKDKNSILSRLMAYATYGKKNMYNNVLNNDELKQLNTDNLTSSVKNLNKYPHQILYYGPLNKNEITNVIKKYHTASSPSFTLSEMPVYIADNFNKNIFYVPYTMQQAEFNLVSKVADFDSKLIPYVELFNNYFGGNMSGVVFQEIRESRALAYAASSRIRMPVNKKYPFIISSYIGTQSDKLEDAMSAIQSLLDSLPYNQASFEAAKKGIIEQIRTERIIKTNVFFTYLNAKRLGLNYDIRKDIFEQAQKITYKDLWQFHKKYLSKKPYNIAIIGDENKLNFDVLKKQGNIQKVSLQEIFGY